MMTQELIDGLTEEKIKNGVREMMDQHGFSAEVAGMI